MTFYRIISLFLGQRYLSVDLLDDNGKFHCFKFFICAFLRKIKKKKNIHNTHPQINNFAHKDENCENYGNVRCDKIKFCCGISLFLYLSRNAEHVFDF
jgi:hypothetical protein